MKTKHTNKKFSLSDEHNNSFCKQVEILSVVDSLNFDHVAIGAVYDSDTEKGLSIAELIIESLNVTNETGLTPREVLKQRDDILSALKQSREALMQCMAELNTHDQYKDNPESICMKMGVLSCNITDQAIKKITT